MKIVSQIPLLIFILIVYAVIAASHPAWLSIPTPNEKLIQSITTESAEDSTVVDATTIPAQPATEDLFSGTNEKPVFLMKLVSGATWGMTLGELLISSALFLLFIEIMKSTRTSKTSVIDHLLSTFVFVLYLVLFLIWDRAGTGVFFILTLISLIDIMCGFTVSIAAARRDVSLQA